MKAVIDDSYREIGRLKAEVKLAEERHRLEQGAIDILRSEKERLEAEAVAQVELTINLYDRITARDKRIAELEAALRFAHAHIDELCDAWERGVISEHDGRGGLRSNRNAAVEMKIRAALKGDADDEG